ncbi:DUF1176 domain-containing protein [Erwinia amylovora]
MKNKYKAALIVTGILAGPAMAEDKGVSFSHKSWEVACDNTLTCRAAGYDKEQWPEGAVVLTRLAGTDTPTTGEVRVDETAQPVKKLTMWLNGKSVGDLAAARDRAWQLSPAQTAELIQAVKGKGKVEFRGGQTAFVVSNQGATAVMVKADDIQGRIDTPGAWGKTGNKPESSVKEAIPAPVMQAAKVSHTQPRSLDKAEVAVLRPRLLATLNDDMDCERMQFPDEPSVQGQVAKDEFMLIPLDEQHSLISTLCWQAAYNQGQAYWVIDKGLAGKPVMVTNRGTNYQQGVISNYFLGNSMGNIATTEEWVWDGKAFHKSHLALYRSVSTEGGWEMPEWVTEVKPAH